MKRRIANHTRNSLKVSYAVCYGEFLYQARSWKYPRRVVCKIEKPAEQLIHKYTFIVTNMDSVPEELIRFYCKRGGMENFIKESKNGFDYSIGLNDWHCLQKCVSSSCPYKDEFYETLENIRELQPQLE